MIDPIEDILRALADPEEMRRREAHRLCASVMHDAILSGIEGPAVGRMVRCVFSDRMKAFGTDPLLFEVGRVYEVVATGFEAFDADDGANATVEEKAIARESMERTAEKFPLSPSLCIVVRDPVSGVQQRITFPSYPGFVFIEAAPGEVDALETIDFKVGDSLVFDKLVTAIADDNVATGVPYEIIGKEAACSCSDPACPGKGLNFAVIKDKDGDLCHVTLPYSYLGIASLL